MCGIVGLFAKDPRLELELGRLLAGMLVTMSDRGPDSAGFAIYSDRSRDRVKITVRAPPNFDFKKLVAGLSSVNDPPITVRDTHATISVPEAHEAAIRAELAQAEGISVVSAGRRMEVFKEVGLPKDVSSRFDLASMSGSHGIGHTRMATESAVTTKGAHPFTTGRDECLVHNGSLSNHNALRRELMRDGLVFETENDTEVAAGYMTWKMRKGMSLAQAMESSLQDLDGFFTFVIGTENGFGVLRDPIACKPAVLAETDQWVAFGTEYRALVDLPSIAQAKVWEPAPAKAYIWERT
jgi:methylamine---glutamate N-methyltransferase subunit A